MVAAAGAMAGGGGASLMKGNAMMSLLGGQGQQGVAGANMIGSGVMSLASGYASLQAAKAQARQYKIQGIFQGLALSQEKLRGREQAVFLRKKFLDNLSSARASFAQRGVSMGSGIGRQFAVQTLRTLQEDVQAAQLNSEAAQIQLRLDASQTKLARETAKNMGYLKAAPKFIKGGQSLLTGFKSIQGAGSNSTQGK